MGRITALLDLGKRAAGFVGGLANWRTVGLAGLVIGLAGLSACGFLLADARGWETRFVTLQRDDARADAEAYKKAGDEQHRRDQLALAAAQQDAENAQTLLAQQLALDAQIDHAPASKRGPVPGVLQDAIDAGLHPKGTRK